MNFESTLREVRDELKEAGAVLYVRIAKSDFLDHGLDRPSRCETPILEVTFVDDEAFMLCALTVHTPDLG